MSLHWVENLAFTLFHCNQQSFCENHALNYIYVSSILHWCVWKWQCHEAVVYYLDVIAVNLLHSIAYNHVLLYIEAVQINIGTMWVGFDVMWILIVLSWLWTCNTLCNCRTGWLDTYWLQCLFNNDNIMTTWTNYITPAGQLQYILELHCL